MNHCPVFMVVQLKSRESCFVNLMAPVRYSSSTRYCKSFGGGLFTYKKSMQWFNISQAPLLARMNASIVWLHVWVGGKQAVWLRWLRLAMQLTNTLCCDCLPRCRLGLAQFITSISELHKPLMRRSGRSWRTGSYGKMPQCVTDWCDLPLACGFLSLFVG
jgi:hypothetical protein